MVGGLLIGIRLNLHKHVQDQLALKMAFTSRQAADELRRQRPRRVGRRSRERGTCGLGGYRSGLGKGVGKGEKISE